MIQINTLTARNFLSVGNVTQAINFNGQALILVLGENLDLGGDDAGSRNGVGKSSIMNALSYALFGTAVSNIKKDNLVNKSNQKNMIVSVEFEKDQRTYRIERGRRPNFLKFYVDDTEVISDPKEVSDESQGDSRETQNAIERVLGLSADMFKHIVTLNTYTEPFINLRSAEQRDLIEQLLGITQLGQKAELLKEQSRMVRDNITREEIRIKTVLDSNDRIQETIKSFEIKSGAWDQKKIQDISNMKSALEQLLTVDIQAELDLHREWAVYRTKLTEKQKLEQQLAAAEVRHSQSIRRLGEARRHSNSLDHKNCPTCEQEINSQQQHKLQLQSQQNIQQLESQSTTEANAVQDLKTQLAALGVVSPPADTFYTEEREAYQHQSSVHSLTTQLEGRLADVNPYLDQIQDLQAQALQVVDYGELQSLTRLRDHQEFLLKLLTSKDSFIRKCIIDQNLNFLNQRLASYLAQLGLPHTVKFQNDLTVEITELGRDLDPGNLSRGEMNRLILGLSFAFRDVWENLYQSINLIFIDEMLDNGTDQSGIENAIKILKNKTRNAQKSVFLISHRDDLTSRVDRILKVVKSNGFTEYVQD